MDKLDIHINVRDIELSNIAKCSATLQILNTLNPLCVTQDEMIACSTIFLKIKVHYTLKTEVWL